YCQPCLLHRIFSQSIELHKQTSAVGRESECLCINCRKRRECRLRANLGHQLEIGLEISSLLSLRHSQMSRHHRQHSGNEQGYCEAHLSSVHSSFYGQRHATSALEAYNDENQSKQERRIQ